MSEELQILLEIPPTEEVFTHISGTYHNLALMEHELGFFYFVFLLIGNYDTALSYLDKTLEMEIELKGESVSSVAIIYSNYSSIYKSMNQHEVYFAYSNI